MRNVLDMVMPLVNNDIWKPLIKMQLDAQHCNYHRIEYNVF